MKFSKRTGRQGRETPTTQEAILHHKSFPDAARLQGSS